MITEKPSKQQGTPLSESRTDLVWRISKHTIDLASIRYRALLPIVALSEQKVTSRVLTRPDIEVLGYPSHLIVVKCFTRSDIELVKRASFLGVHTIFDLCDNIFVPGYGRGETVLPAEVLRAMLPYLRAIVVPTKSLAAVVKQELGKRIAVHIVPDGVEDETMLARQRAVLRSTPQYCKSKVGLRVLSRALWQRLTRVSVATPAKPLRETLTALEGERTILWFGNHGSPWSTFGLADIVACREVLEKIAREHNVRLVVVSNNLSRFKAEIQPLSIRSVYLDWTSEGLHAALQMADVVIVPNALDEFAVCKSANRALLALNAGVPVVATRTPALETLQGCIWLDDFYEGISTYLGDPGLVQEHLACGRLVIEREFSASVIARKWQEVLEVPVCA